MQCLICAGLNPGTSGLAKSVVKVKNVHLFRYKLSPAKASALITSALPASNFHPTLLTWGGLEAEPVSSCWRDTAEDLPEGPTLVAAAAGSRHGGGGGGQVNGTRPSCGRQKKKIPFLCSPLFLLHLLFPPTTPPLPGALL